MISIPWKTAAGPATCARISAVRCAIGSTKAGLSEALERRAVPQDDVPEHERIAADDARWSRAALATPRGSDVTLTVSPGQCGCLPQMPDGAKRAPQWRLRHTLSRASPCGLRSKRGPDVSHAQTQRATAWCASTLRASSGSRWCRRCQRTGAGSVCVHQVFVDRVCAAPAFSNQSPTMSD